MAFQLVPLPYAYDALEPYIDAQTMTLHHDKHHAAYVNNLNAALEKHPELDGKSLEDLLGDLNAVPEDIRMVVRNHGGGTWNHNLFWVMMAPKAAASPPATWRRPSSLRLAASRLQRRLRKGCHGPFRQRLGLAERRPDGSLAINSTANQDNPLSEGLFPLSGHRCLGARLLPEVSEPAHRVYRQLVECGQLGRDRPAFRHEVGVQENRAFDFLRRTNRKSAAICINRPASVWFRWSPLMLV